MLFNLSFYLITSEEVPQYSISTNEIFKTNVTDAHII